MTKTKSLSQQPKTKIKIPWDKGTVNLVPVFLLDVFIIFGEDKERRFYWGEYFGSR